MNPLSIGTILRCLFVPTSFGSTWSTLYSDAADHYPTGPVVWVGGFLDDSLTGFWRGIDHGSDLSTCDLQAPFPTAPGHTTYMPVIPGAGDDDVCSVDQIDTYATVADITSMVSTVGFWVGGALMVWRLVSGLMGGGEDVVTSEA